MVGTSFLNRLGSRRYSYWQILAAALRLGTGGLGAQAEIIEVVDAVAIPITQSRINASFSCTLVILRFNTRVLAIFCLHRHIIVECDIHTQ